MKLLRSRRAWFVAAILVLLLFLVRPGWRGLKSHVTKSISAALGRPVDIDKVHLRLLPQPGFDLANFVVYDDPGFSAEPMLRAQEVMAAIRLRSLLRGKVEISRLNLAEPSLNLVRNQDEHWNIETLLERAARIPVAPTDKNPSEPRPGFPYIEASQGRINFKFGPEKKPYALTNADFSLWQDSENAWAMRLKAQPVRTDFNLSDTGLLELNGTWQRASNLRRTPLQFNVRWAHAQLGQLTKLISGRDRGWRGSVSATLTLSGNPADLRVNAATSVDDFHRYDVISGSPLRLIAQCVARYSAVDRTFRRVICGAPVGEGTVSLQGEVTELLAPHSFDLTLSAEALPIQALVELARHSKKELPEDLLASGTLDGNFSVRKASTGALELRGEGETESFHLSSVFTKTELDLGEVPFSVVRGGPTQANNGKRTKVSGKSKPTPEKPELSIGPFHLGLGRPIPVAVRGWVSKSGYTLEVNGEAQVKRLLQVARTFGVPASQFPVEGIAKVNLQIAGQWPGFAAPSVSGTAQLSSVRAEVRGLNAPLEITSASLALLEDQLKFQNVIASLGASRWSGSVSVPRRCVSPETCPLVFDFHTDKIATADLGDLVNPEPRKRPWYRLLAPSVPPGPSILSAVQASGKIAANRVVMGNFGGNHLSANLELRKGKLRISDLRAEALGGKLVGDWLADFSVKAPVYSGSGSLERISLGQIADAMQDGWITGSANAMYRVSASGYNITELWSSADGTLQSEMRDGTLPHIALSSGSAPLHVRRFHGTLNLRDGQFEIEQGKLDTGTGIYQVSGTASLGRKLNIRIAHDSSHGFNITGTVDEPRVVSVSSPQTQAALKP